MYSNEQNGPNDVSGYLPSHDKTNSTIVVWTGETYVLYGKLLKDGKYISDSRIFICPSDVHFASGVPENVGISGATAKGSYQQWSSADGAPETNNADPNSPLVADMYGKTATVNKTNHSGISVIFLDGHTEFIVVPYPWRISHNPPDTAWKQVLEKKYEPIP
jgi:hypothetical protein